MTNCTVPATHYDNGLIRLPSWFKQDIPDMQKIEKMKNMFRGSRLHTVCESARCPNMGQCWGQGVATFMILGNTCTRACRFCSIKAGIPDELDKDEPRNVALAVKALDLRYVVITSVARDDLPDEGADHFVKTIEAIRQESPKTKIELLIPDLSARRELIQIVGDANPEVISHNIETVRRLSEKVRSKAVHDRSLKALRLIKECNANIIAKSSIMVGLGETQEEVVETMQELLDVGCEIVTIGQYLAPTRGKRHLRIERFAKPEEYDYYRREGEALGFKHVMAGPLVRSSYIAEEGYKAVMQAH